MDYKQQGKTRKSNGKLRNRSEPHEMIIATIDAGNQPWMFHIRGGLRRCYGDTGADLRVSPAVTRLTVYRLPQVGANIDKTGVVTSEYFWALYLGF